VIQRISADNMFPAYPEIKNKILHVLTRGFLDERSKINSPPQGQFKIIQTFVTEK
jgi:hypothetical protein